MAELRIAQKARSCSIFEGNRFKEGECLVGIKTQFLRGCLVSWNDLGHWHQVQVTIMPDTSCLTFSKLFNFLSLSILICKMGIMISVSLDKHSISVCCHSPFEPSSQPCFPEPNKYHLPASAVPMKFLLGFIFSTLFSGFPLFQEEGSQSPVIPSTSRPKALNRHNISIKRIL